MTIKERLIEIIKATNLNVSSFSELIGVKEGTTRMYISRGSKPSSDYLEKIVRAIENINSEWLLTGEGEMMKDTTPHPKIISPEVAQRDGLPDGAIPLYDIEIHAGNVQRLIEANDDIPLVGWLHLEDMPAKGLIGVRAKGNSMASFINGGDTMLIRKLENLRFVPFGDAYVIITKEQTVVKYIRAGSTGDTWVLRSHNHEIYQDFEIHKEDVLHLFVVVKVLKELTY